MIRDACRSIRENLFIGVRESIILRGFGNVLYYCSLEGETAIRRVVYDQILTQLDAVSDADEVRLHIFGHILGVTLTHDFLYGLFAEAADGYRGSGSHAEGEKHWRLGRVAAIHWRPSSRWLASGGWWPPSRTCHPPISAPV